MVYLWRTILSEHNAVITFIACNIIYSILVYQLIKQAYIIIVRYRTDYRSLPQKTIFTHELDT